MATYKYTGSSERVFPTLGITVKSGDTFQGPDNFIAKNVELTSSAPKPKAPETSAPSDKNAGE